MFLGEALRFSVQALRANPARSLLTGLGMVIGTASVILVVTISLTSRDYILEQIQGVGSNIIFAYYASAGPSTAVSDADYIKMADVEALRQNLGADIVAATGVMTNFDRILIGGKEQDVKVIGTDQAYQPVRNIVVSSGRFLDEGDVSLRQKVGLLTDQLATRMYGSQASALNQVIKLFGLEFTVIGTFHEKVETFGQSEVERDTILVPITVLRYFTPVERIDPMYVQVRSPEEVDRVALRVQEVLEARHRSGARYRVDTLTAILNAAKKHFTDSVAGAGAGFDYHAADFGHRDHEHHAGDGDGADAGDWRAAGGGRVQEGDPDSVSDRGNHGEPFGRPDRDSGRGGNSLERAVVRRHPDSDFGPGDCGGLRGKLRGGPGVRHFAGEPCGAVESDRSSAIRVDRGVGFSPPCPDSSGHSPNRQTPLTPQPASTVKTSPVMERASSPSRKSAARATSSASIMPPVSGCFLPMKSFSSGVA